MPFLLALVVAVISRTVTQEEIFRELRVWCDKHKSCGCLIKKKLAYLPTCRYCFSHWVTALVLWFTRYQMAYTDWRGYVVAGFVIVGIANMYLAIYERLVLDTAKVRAEIKQIEAFMPTPQPEVFDVPSVDSARRNGSNGHHVFSHR